MKLHEIAAEPLAVSLTRKLLAKGEKVEFYNVARFGSPQEGFAWRSNLLGTIYRFVDAAPDKVIAQYLYPGATEFSSETGGTMSCEAGAVALKKANGTWHFTRNTWYNNEGWKKAHPQDANDV
jgi:hypothetical protein